MIPDVNIKISDIIEGGPARRKSGIYLEMLKAGPAAILIIQ